MTGSYIRLFLSCTLIQLTAALTVSCDVRPGTGAGNVSSQTSDTVLNDNRISRYQPVYAMLILPEKPAPGEPFRVVAAGGTDIRKAQIRISGPSGETGSLKSITGNETPCWRIDDFSGCPTGTYNATMVAGGKELSSLQFIVTAEKGRKPAGVIWRTTRGWDPGTEAIYSVWINALFQGCGEQASWSSLNEVTQNRERNFLYNHLSLDEDLPAGGNSVVMSPDCADNPFFLRAYFAWKLGLPFGYHICDRGSISSDPRTGQWITNETYTSQPDPVKAFNAFLRKIMDGVHSGTARTALDNESSDYYPVPLDTEALRPGTVFADPYGHTLTLVRRVPQTRNSPGLLLAVDAQPDGTIGIKRFWKGNFLFNTTGVVGEPGFKAFRPIAMKDGLPEPVRNGELNESSGYIPYSLQQRGMSGDDFYGTMERIINPAPLDPDEALINLINALYEQLTVRITSVANGENYIRSHPGTVIPMPTNAAGIFLAGGLWESYSTPNRDLRLLIAMDEVLGFPDRVARSPRDFNIPETGSAEKVREELQSLLEKRASALTITYTRTDGSPQTLTVRELLARRDAFEMGYNPNDGIEIRWGAPEGSNERSTCKRHAPAMQLETMRKVRTWFQQRLHPPT